jgi:hypothetical protein
MIQPEHTFTRKRSLQDESAIERPWVFPLLATAAQLDRSWYGATKRVRLHQPMQSPVCASADAERKEDAKDECSAAERALTALPQCLSTASPTPCHPYDDIHAHHAEVPQRRPTVFTNTLDLHIGLHLTESLIDGPFANKTGLYADTAVTVDPENDGLLRLTCHPVPAFDTLLLDDIIRDIDRRELLSVMYWSNLGPVSHQAMRPVHRVHRVSSSPSLVAFLRRRGLPGQDPQTTTGVSDDDSNHASQVTHFIEQHETLFGFTLSSDILDPKQLDSSSLYVFQRLPLAWKRFIATFLLIDVVNGTAVARLERRQSTQALSAKQAPVLPGTALTMNTSFSKCSEGVADQPAVDVSWRFCTPTHGKQQQSWILPLVDLGQMAAQLQVPPNVTVQWGVQAVDNVGLDLTCSLRCAPLN